MCHIHSVSSRPHPGRSFRRRATDSPGSHLDDATDSYSDEMDMEQVQLIGSMARQKIYALRTDV